MLNLNYCLSGHVVPFFVSLGAISTKNLAESMRVDCRQRKCEVGCPVSEVGLFLFRFYLPSSWRWNFVSLV